MENQTLCKWGDGLWIFMVWWWQLMDNFMFKRFAFLIFILSYAMLVFPQIQKGIVQTRGRVDERGVHVPGVGIPNVFIKVKGSNEVGSAADGSFELNLLGNDFYLESVIKKGYVLVDQDMLSKQYQHSANKLVIVLTTPEQRVKDEIAAEKRLRAALQKRLQEKENEILALKERNELNEEEYNKALKELLASQETSEKHIKEMIERYSRMDYDQLDETNRMVAFYLEQGEL